MAAADRGRRHESGARLDRAQSALGCRRHCIAGARGGRRVYAFGHQAICRRRAFGRHSRRRRGHTGRQHNGGRGQPLPGAEGFLRDRDHNTADNRRDPQIMRDPARYRRTAREHAAGRTTSRVGAAVAPNRPRDRGIGRRNVRRRATGARHDRRLRQDPHCLRQADRQLPGRQAPARRHARGDRERQVADLLRRLGDGSEPRRSAARSVDGQGRRVRYGPLGRRHRHSIAWRHWHDLGTRSAAVLQARKGHRGRIWRRHLAPRARRPADDTLTALPPRQNNFDALRLVAAVSVIFSHSFLISEGTQNNEWLMLLTGNQSILGLTGVFVFFAISGFLVTQSFEQTANPMHFLAKRALRIFPGLFVATLLSAFVLGPLVTTLPLNAYLSRPEPYEYVVGNTLLDQNVHQLPEVSFVQNPVGQEINGSLWTLRLEFTMYLMVLGLGLLRRLTLRVALLLIAFGVACLHFDMLDSLE